MGCHWGMPKERQMETLTDSEMAYPLMDCQTETQTVSPRAKLMATCSVCPQKEIQMA